MNRLKEMRIKRKKTQPELAERLCIDRSTYTKWENGTHMPDVKTLLLISQILNTSVSYLIGESDDPEPIKKKPASELDDGLREWATIYHLIPSERRKEYRAMLEAALQSQGLI